MNYIVQKLDNTFSRIFNNKGEQNKTTAAMLMDLSDVPDDALGLILLRVPANELVKVCTQVSKQWNRVLSEKGFWRDKMAWDGCKLDWPKLAGLPLHAYQIMAIKRPFGGRNLIRDTWDLSKRSGENCCKLDPRWRCNKPIKKVADNRGGSQEIRYEVPPVFLDGQPEMSREICPSPVLACLATGNDWYRKRIVIELADEGLFDEIMDAIRPTIVVSELVGNRRDCSSIYLMECFMCKCRDTALLGRWESVFKEEEEEDKREQRKEFQLDIGNHSGPDHSIGANIQLKFRQWDAEGWNQVKHVFRDYPAGMRFLVIGCWGKDGLFWAGHYGVKMANCSVEILL